MLFFRVKIHADIFSAPFHVPLNFVHWAHNLDSLLTCPPDSSAPSISSWMNVSTTCGRSGASVYFSEAFLHSSVHTPEIITDLAPCVQPSPPVLLNPLRYLSGGPSPVERALKPPASALRRPSAAPLGSCRTLCPPAVCEADETTAV